MTNYNLDHSDIHEVCEIATQGYSTNSGTVATKKVNDLLDRGWVLLKIYTTCYDPIVAPQQQTIHYVLGIEKYTKQANDDFDAGLISGPPQDE